MIDRIQIIIDRIFNVLDITIDKLEKFNDLICELPKLPRVMIQSFLDVMKFILGLLFTVLFVGICFVLLMLIFLFISFIVSTVMQSVNSLLILILVFIFIAYLILIPIKYFNED